MSEGIHVHSETGQTLISCCGRKHARVRPWRREGSLLPLSRPHRPLHSRSTAKPPFEDGRIPHSREQGKQRLLFRVSDLRDNRAMLKDRHTVNTMMRLMEEHDNDPYGPENLYSGSCVQVHGDQVFHTDWRGRLLVTELGEDQSRRLPRAPIGKPVTGPSCRPLAHTRVYSIETKEDGMKEGCLLVLAKHRLGAALSRVTTGEDGDMSWANVRGFPCSKGAAAASLLPQGRAATLDMNGCVNFWDISSQLCSGRLQLKHLTEEDTLRWGWGALSRSMHPNQLLVADRAGISLVDSRNANISAHVGLDLGYSELLRGVAEGRSSHLVYSATDARLLLSDLRHTNAPLLSLQHDIAGRGRAPIFGLSIGEVGGEDWGLAYSRWGELALSVLDWQHSMCSSWQAVEEEAMALLCREGPSIMGRQSSVLRGWSNSVERARNLGGSWLDTHVEERVAVPFTGADISKEEDGSVVIYLSNALGDLFAKQLVRKEDEEEEDASIEDEVVVKREETWMEEWGELVEECALLPRVKLMSDTQEVLKQGAAKQQWTLPRAARTRAQMKERGNHLLPRPKKSTFKPQGERKIEGSKGEILRKALNSAYLEQFGSHGASNRDEISQKAMTKASHMPETTFVEQLERHRIKRRDTLGISGPKSFQAKCYRKEGKEKAWKQLAGIEDDNEEEETEVGKVGFLKQFPVVSLDQYLPGKGANRHTEAMLQVLLGQDELTQKREEPGVNSSRRVSGAELGEAAAPPRETDTYYPMDTFWDDLGVGAPHVNKTGNVSGQPADEDEEGLYEL